MEFTAVVVQAHPPSRSPRNIGVLLVDETEDSLLLRFRTDLDTILDPDDAEIIRGMPDYFVSVARDLGAVRFLLNLEDTASNMIRVEGRTTIEARNAHEALDRAFADAIR